MFTVYILTGVTMICVILGSLVTITFILEYHLPSYILTKYDYCLGSVCY